MIVAHDGQRVDAGDGDDLVCLVADDYGIEADAGPGDDTVDATRSSDFSVVSLGPARTASSAAPERTRSGARLPRASTTASDPLATPSATRSRRAAGTTRCSRARSGQPTSTGSPPGGATTACTLKGLDHALSLDVGGGRNTARSPSPPPRRPPGWSTGHARPRVRREDLAWQGRLHRWYFTMAKGRRGPRWCSSARAPMRPSSSAGPSSCRTSAWATATTGRLAHHEGRHVLPRGRPRPADAGQVRVGVGDVPVGLTDRGPPTAPGRFRGRGPEPGLRRREAEGGCRAGRVLGTRAGEHIPANGCSAQVDGGIRGDLLKRGEDIASICPSVSSRLRGGAGDDLLLGSNRTDDVLVGGPGLDRARGMRGTTPAAPRYA